MDWSDSCFNIPKNEESNRTVEIEIPFHLLQFLSSEGSNIKNVCRICLSMQQNMICLFSSRKLPLTLPSMLASFTSMKAQPGDGLPTQICDLCEAQVISCYNFKVKCEKSEHTLKSLLKGEIIAQESQSNPKEVKQKEAVVGNVKEHKDATTTYLLETSDKSTCTTFYDGKEHDIEDIKGEVEIHEDIQYLEALSDDVSDEETLCIVQNIKSAKRKTSNNTAAKLESERSTNKNKTSLDSVLTCTYCYRRFKKQKALRAHLKKKHGSEVTCHQCPQCTEAFNSEHDLALHSALHTKGPMWKCNTCPKEFKTKSMLRRHLSRHMESKRYSCAHCDKTFVEMYALRRHARVHTGELREKKHVCHICDKRYSENNLLVAHMTTHSGKKPFPCMECGKDFASARLLQSHRAVHSARKPYACRYCDRRFRHETTLKTHHRTHTGERPYVCATCGKAFIQNSNLRLHMRTHTGERPYPCSQCSRRFSSGSSLKNHQRTHSGEKPYACPFCSKRFARVNFKAHMRQHTGDKPFECSVCLKKFVGAARLRDHCRIHTGEKPFECTVCAECFATKSHLKKHLKSHEDGKKPKSKVVIVKQIENYAEEAKPLEQEETAHTLEVSGELVVENDSEEKTEILVVDNAQAADFQNGNICLEGVTYVNSGVTYDGDNINLVTMNEGGVSISSTSAMLEGTTVKLYQIDQSLLQIHSTGAQVTISKITSKMTANF